MYAVVNYVLYPQQMEHPCLALSVPRRSYQIALKNAVTTGSPVVAAVMNLCSLAHRFCQLVVSFFEIWATVFRTRSSPITNAHTVAAFYRYFPIPNTHKLRVREAGKWLIA